MILQLLGLIDIFVSVNLFLVAFGHTFEKLIYWIFGYLLVKNILTIKDPMSIVELLIGIILITSLFVTWPKAVLIASALIILQKAFFSLI